MFYRFSLLILCFIFSTMPIFGKEVEVIKFESLPDVVKKTASSFFNIKNITKITKISDEEEHIRFNLESDKTFNKKGFIAKEIILANNGKIIKLVREVPYFALSSNLMNEIQKKFPDIKVNEVESVQYHYFDVSGELNGQKTQFRLYEDGTITQFQPEQN